jgi:phage tail sheath protein FI
VISAAFKIGESRGDALAIHDTPLGLSPQDVVDWHNGAGTFTDHQAFNSSYGALYWSWQEIYDSPNGVKVWVPPSGLVAAAMAYSARVSELWFAPAGLKRGLLTSVLRSEYNPDPGEQQLLYTNGNNINPIIKHPQAGIAIFGQKTLQRMPSATDRVNVRLLLNYLRKIIAGTAAYLAFDPNDRVTWNEFEDLVEPVLRNIKVKRGLYDYRIQMDETTVTADHIDGYAMPGKIFIQPVKAAEEIPIDFIITRTGAEFLTYEQV